LYRLTGAYHAPHRPATPADIPFLAWTEYEASLPPGNYSYWDYPIMGFDIESIPFIETVLRTGAGAWGEVEDFVILERAGQPVAAAAGIVATPELSEGPVRVRRIEALAAALGWTPETTATFRERYLQAWPNPNGNPILLPQAPFIIESVAVVPEARGQGLVAHLIQHLCEKAQALGCDSVGISAANGNDSARRAYEKLGFELYVAFGPAFFGGAFPGYSKFKRSLR
jgi:ribosomal protein S18 acetylase RimI-like enzyme